MLSVILRCAACGWQTTAGAAEVERRLRKLGLLRRAPEPPEDLVAELLATHAERLTCDACGEAGLAVDDPTAGDGDEWEQVVACEVCREPIPPERLEVIPGTKRCTRCQGEAEAGIDHAEPDFCPRCGALVELRVSRGSGITRYKRFCTGDPPCRL